MLHRTHPGYKIDMELRCRAVGSSAEESQNLSREARARSGTFSCRTRAVGDAQRRYGTGGSDGCIAWYKRLAGSALCLPFPDPSMRERRASFKCYRDTRQQCATKDFRLHGWEK